MIAIPFVVCVIAGAFASAAATELAPSDLRSAAKPVRRKSSGEHRTSSLDVERGPLPVRREHPMNEEVAEHPSHGGLVDGCSAADSDIHIVFSTGCNAFQNWQAEVFLNTAYHVGQCGKMTRIVVGCEGYAAESTSEDKRTSTSPDSPSTTKLIGSQVHQSTFPGLRVHVAPAIEEARKFPWFNKPWSFYHWLQNKPEPLERVIAILDPDEFFFQPLTQRGGVLEEDADTRAKHPEAWPLLKAAGKARTDVVQPGMAVAQHYGLGTSFLRIFDKKTICPGEASSPCANLNEADASEYYPAGPPYLLHRDDFKKIAPAWWDLMKPVYAKDKGDIQADMYAYIYAAVHHEVKHSLFTQYMVSDVDAPGEGWDWIDDVHSMSCHNPEFPEGHPRPGFLHAAQNYMVCTKGDATKNDMTDCTSPGSEIWNFHKGHVPGEILNCEHPLLMAPPDDFFNTQVKVQNSRGKRGAFMVCNLVSMVNRAALQYKEKFCHSGYNAKKCTRIVVQPGGNHPFNATNPWNYPLALVDGDCVKQ